MKNTLSKLSIAILLSASLFTVACEESTVETTVIHEVDMEESVDSGVVETKQAATPTCGNWTFQTPGVSAQGSTYSQTWSDGLNRGEVFTDGYHQDLFATHYATAYQQLTEDPYDHYLTGFTGGFEVSSGYAIIENGTQYDNVYFWGKPVFADQTGDSPINAEIQVIDNQNGCVTYQVNGEAAAYNWVLDFFFPGELPSQDFQYTFQVAAAAKPDKPTEDDCMRWETHFGLRGQVGSGYLARWATDQTSSVLIQDTSFSGLPPKMLGFTASDQAPTPWLVGEHSFWAGRYQLSNGQVWNDGGGSYLILAWLSPKVHIGSWQTIATLQGGTKLDQVFNYFVAVEPDALPPYCEGIPSQCADDVMDVLNGVCSNVLQGTATEEVKINCVQEHLPASCEGGGNGIEWDSYEECAEAAASKLEERQQTCTDTELEERAQCESAHPPGENRDKCYGEAAKDYHRCARRALFNYAAHIGYCRMRYPRDPEDAQITSDRDTCMNDCKNIYNNCSTNANGKRENCENACGSNQDCLDECSLTYHEDMYFCQLGRNSCEANCESDYP